MLMVLFLLSITGDEAPTISTLPNPTVAASARQTRCENAREQLVREGEALAPMLRPLGKEPLANAYRPVVRFAHCDTPVLVVKRLGQRQR